MPASLSTQGSGVLSSFALRASWLSKKQQLLTFLFFLDFPLSLPHILPNSLLTLPPHLPCNFLLPSGWLAWEAQPIITSVAHCNPKQQPTPCLALLSPALTVLVYFDQFASPHRSPNVCPWQWVRAGCPRTAKVVPVQKCPQELGSLSPLPAPQFHDSTCDREWANQTHVLPTSRTVPPGFRTGTWDLSVQWLCLRLLEHVLSAAAAAAAQTWHSHHPAHSAKPSLR